MNKIQQKYNAFMESVCAQFNCKQALPALKQGFKAFCEAVDVDYDPFDIDNMVANASDAEFGAENNDSRYNIDRVTGQGSVDFDEGDADDTNVALVTQRLAKRMQVLFDRESYRALSARLDDRHDNWIVVNVDGVYMGTVVVSGNTVTAEYPEFSDGNGRALPFSDVKCSVSKFDLDDPQLADNVAAVYLDRAISVSSKVNELRRESYDETFARRQKILNAGADMNDDEFANALRNHEFDGL